MLDGWIARRIGCGGELTRAALEAWQLARLNETVEWARANSAFYRERLPVGRLTSLAQISSLPFTTPEDLRTNGTRMLCVSPRDIERVVTLATSGSTGAPKRIFFTGEEQESTIEYFRYGIAEFVFPGERVMSLFPGRSPGSLNDLLSQALRRLGAEPLVFGFPTQERYEELLNDILERKVDFLVGAAETVAAVARLSRQMGVAPQLAKQVRGVLLAAAFVSKADRSEIEQTWDCRVDEHYSMTETAFAGAVGCPTPGGYHVWESDLYYEIIDPTSGEVQPDGVRGEIVVTTLSRKAMPMVRYRTGDFSRFLPGDCPCGSMLRRLGRVEKRMEPKVFSERRVTRDL